MLFRDIFKFLSTYLCAFALTLLVPLSVAFYFQFYAFPPHHPQPHSTGAFAATIVICLGVAGAFRFLGRKARGQLFLREGLAAVVMIWVLSPIIGALPFYLSGTLTNPTQAYFESVSGLTTTGATVMIAKRYDVLTGEELPLERTIPGIYDTQYSYYGTIEPVRDPVTGEELYSGIEAVSKGLLFWRSMMQWLGGMGIVVLFVAILPALGVGGRILLQAEMPGPIKDTFTPRIKETASQLWKIYFGLTLVEIALLCWSHPGMSLYEATTITFSTLSTGGFSTKNRSIGSFQNPSTDWIVIIFMLLGSLNFSLYYHSLRGKIYRIYEPEFLIYIVILMLTCSFATYHLYGAENILLTGEKAGTFSFAEALRYGTFHMVSSQTSTGFVTTDYDMWPYPVQGLMLIVMFLGGMSGSTAGGMKIARPYMLFKILQTRVESMFRPEAVRRIHLGTRKVDSGVVQTVLCFFLTLTAFTVIGTFLYICDGVDPETAISLTSCMVNNVGIAFRMDGPTESCAFLSNISLMLSSLWMLMGRLEFFAVLVLFVPAFWRENS